ncbi:DNA-binding protein [Cupriavidus sp. CP313]
MRSRGISAADVVRACVALKKQQRRVGPVNVRLELGRGSYSTIVRHLRTLAFRDSRQRP